MKKTKLLTLILVLCCAIFVLVACDNDTDKETQTTEQTEDLGKNDKEEPSESNSDENDSSNETSTEHTHEYGEWTVTKEASCTEKGSEKRTCACGEEETREIAKKAHTEETVAGKDATCAESGLTEGKKCSVCGTVIVEQSEITATGKHDYKNLKCKICGLELTPSEGLYFELNTDGESYYVSDFGICTDRDVVIPYTYEGKPVTSIGEYAFEDCKGVMSVIIPDSVTSIGNYAFEHCEGLTSITIPDSVTSIGDNAFSSCTRLMRVTIGNSVTSIGDNAFSGCTRLMRVTIGNSVTSIGSYAFYNCTGLTSVTIPDSVTSIGRGAFEDCTGLTSVTIGNSVTSIGSYAFYNCTGLTSVTIPDSVTSIGNYAFEHCEGLTSVTIPDSVTSIGNYAFEHCEGLTSVTIGNGVTGIGTQAFYGCTNLNFNEYDNAKYLGNSSNPYLILFSSASDDITTCNINQNTKIICYSAFSGCTRLASITIPDSVTSIGDWAFSGCKRITSITIPDSVTSIGSSAFSGCTGLTSITLPFVGAEKDATSNTHFGYIFGASSSSENDDCVPASLKTVVITGGTSIGSFYNCTGLTSITIPDSVTSIGDYAFHNCTNLNFNEYDNALYLGNSNNPYLVLVSSKSDDITTCNINQNTKIIYSSAFSGCWGLTSITIPDSVASIGDSAFYKCTGLTSITIPDSVTSIGDYAFDGCKRLTSITIPDSVTSIGDYAFDGCTNLNFNEYGNAKYLGNSSNPYLVLVSSKSDDITTCNINQNTKIIYSSAFYDCTMLTSITIPDSVTSIGEDAFRGCSGLTSITIPNSVTSIGYYAFLYCSRLTSITIPDSVASIGDSAFYKCTGLTSITIPDSVTSIGKAAFSDCSGLTDIYFNGTKTQWEAIDKYTDWMSGSWNSNTGNYTVHCDDGDISK